MVAPVVGPTTVVEDYEVHYRNRSCYKQARPFTLELPYSCYYGDKTVATGNLAGPGRSPSQRTNQIANAVLASTVLNQTKMRAYDKFKSKMFDSASMGENLVDFKQSLGTIENRLLQIYDFTRAIKRGHLGHAASILRSPLPKKKHPVKEAANNWLEFHLGIEPLVNDIYTAVDILQQPIKNTFVKAGADGGSFSLGSYRSTQPAAVGVQDSACNSLGVQYRAEVAISNPNLFLANSLGLVNPALVAYQAATLSFVLDWFVNVEQFLGTATDFFGLTILKSSTTVRWTGSYQEIWNTYGWQLAYKVGGIVRSPGISLPGLGFRPYRGTSWQRGLTAASLLVGGLKSLDTTNYNPKRRHQELFRFDSNRQGMVAERYDWRHERHS